MLHVENLTAGYGDIIAVRNFSFAVSAGEILTLLGANGAGKTSTLMCLMGLVEMKSGVISFKNEKNFSAMAVERRISEGMAIVPEGRRVFHDLSVHENLIVGGHIVDQRRLSQNIDRVYGVFPRLGERRSQLAGSLSGGEQQMLAMGRALISEPQLLIVDELSLGLMPRIVDECYDVLQKLREDGLAIVLVEQNTDRALSVADNVCLLEAGNLIWTGNAEQAQSDSTLRDKLLGMN